MEQVSDGKLTQLQPVLDNLPDRFTPSQVGVPEAGGALQENSAMA